MHNMFDENAENFFVYLVTPRFQESTRFKWWALTAESVGRVLSEHQLGKPSDVRRIMSSHEGSFVFIIQPN